MARVGETIEHPLTGGRLTFLEAAARQLPKHGHLIESRHVRVSATRGTCRRFSS
jgi:hypothetical protein